MVGNFLVDNVPLYYKKWVWLFVFTGNDGKKRVEILEFLAVERNFDEFLDDEDPFGEGRFPDDFTHDPKCFSVYELRKLGQIWKMLLVFQLE